MLNQDRHLWLLRHAKAEHDFNHDDFNRALTKKGRLHARRLGIWMRQHQLIPDFIICSSAVRAHQTAVLVTEQLELSESNIQLENELYLANAQQLLRRLQQLPDHYANVLIVGHNPTLEELALLLSNGAAETEHDKMMLPATLVTLLLDKDWAQLAVGCARRQSIIHGKLL